MANTYRRRIRRTLAALWRSDEGAILVEFAYSMPVFVLLGMVSLELVNLALANMRISLIAMTVADNLSRAKESVPLGLPRLREVDINDALLGTSLQGGSRVQVLKKGRVIISSLQRNSSGRQTIAWQRCKGELNVSSLYGAQGATQPATGTSGFQGMGTGSTRIQAEANTAVIFAEVVYNYEPIIGNWIFGARRIRKEAAFYVRDDRDLTTVYNPSPSVTASACNVFNSTF